MWTQICVLAVSRGRLAENGGQLGEAKTSQNEDSAWEAFIKSFRNKYLYTNVLFHIFEAY